MVSGPPCAQCGYPLRWFAEQNAWGCDRCRQMFPAQPQMAPQPQMQMAPQPQMQMQPPGAKKGSGAKIAIAAVVVIGAIVTIAVVASGGGKGDEALKKLEAARDRICACTDEACVRDGIAEIGHITEQADMSKEQHAKGSKILDEVLECTKKVSGTEAPPAQAGEGDAMLRELRQLRDRTCACADKACTAAAAAETKTAMAKYKTSFDAMPGSVRRDAMEILQAQLKCVDAFGGTGAAPSQPAKPTETADDTPPEECAEWKAALDRLKACDDFPKDNAARLEKAYLQMAESWRQVPRAQLVAGCKASADSLAEAVNAVCPE